MSGSEKGKKGLVAGTTPPHGNEKGFNRTSCGVTKESLERTKGASKNREEKEKNSFDTSTITNHRKQKANSQKDKMEGTRGWEGRWKVV